MANLAIKGHATRGSEVIALLEMLGGINKYNLRGSEDEWFVLNKTLIQRTDRLFAEKGFSLEEFLEKFPYKVGDKIVYKIYGIHSKIKTMLWNVEKEQVFYSLESHKLFVATADELKPYKEETMEDTSQMTEKQIVFGDDAPKITKIVFGDYFEFKYKDGIIYIDKKNPQYPKTYEECCKILGKTTFIGFDGLSLDEAALYKPFIQLKRCRDAYWKIAGEQMGLGEPWEPNWEDDSWNDMYYISYDGKIISKETGFPCCNIILIFPTEEMRDAFYENFKELIEECKELL